MNRTTIPKIDLSDKNLQLLPKAIFQEKCLQNLDLSGNQLRQRPSTSGSKGNNTNKTKEDDIKTSELFYCAGFLDDLIVFQNLLVLDLSYNDLVIFPVSICGIISLRHLDLSGNELTSIPLQIKRLTRLHVLSIHGNKIKALPRTFQDLHQLQRLDASCNEFSQFPTVLKRMKNLRKILFSENRFLDDMPEDNMTMYKIAKKMAYKEFESLSYVDLSENMIERLDLRSLPTLQHLRCCQNRLFQLQVDGQCMISLCASNNALQYVHCNNNPLGLRLLDLSNNCFSEIPDWVCSISSIQSLNFSHNQIKILPENFWQNSASCSRLINLSYNLLDEIPEIVETFNVQKLLLHHNNIHQLPVNMFSPATKIRTLNLSSNNISALPMNQDTAIHKQSELVELYISFNHLDNDVWNVLLNIPMLQILHLAYNIIEDISPRIADMLQYCREINLAGNKIKTLPDIVPKLTWLRILRVNSNLLSNLTSFSNSAHLRVLDASYNTICNFSVDMIPNNLEILDLTGNKSQQDLKSLCRNLQHCSSRNVHLVNVSDNVSANILNEPNVQQLPWKFGFSKSSNSHEGMSFHQILHPKVSKMQEAFFGIIHANVSKDNLKLFKCSLPKILQEEQTCHESSSKQYLRYTLLRAQRLLHGIINGVDCATILCHMFMKKSTKEMHLVLGTDDDNFAMVLCRKGSALKIPWHDDEDGDEDDNDEICTIEKQLQNKDKKRYDYLHIREMKVEREDEFLVIANCSFWDYVHAEETVKRCRNCGDDPLLMAKLLHDLAQGFGCRQDLSVIVVKFIHFDQQLRSIDDVLVSIVSNAIENDSLVEEDGVAAASAASVCSENPLPSTMNVVSDWNKRLTEAELCNSSEYITEMSSKLLVNDFCTVTSNFGNGDQAVTMKPKYFGDTLINVNSIKVSWRDLYSAKRKNYRL